MQFFKQNKTRLNDVFTKVEERWQKYGSTVCGNPAHNVTFLLG